MLANIFGWGKGATSFDDVRNSPIKNLQDAINELTRMEASFTKLTKDPEIVGSCMFLKEIDLVRVLDATVYNAKIDNKLCDVKMIISSIKKGFNNLVCTQVGCIHKAVMCHKLSNDTPAELYCEKHSNLVDPHIEGQNDFDAERRKDISILESLERLLVVVQEQMEFLKDDNLKKDKIAYSSIKDMLYEKFNYLKYTLKEMSMKAQQIVTEEIKAKIKPRYEPLTFVKKDSEICMKSIQEILRMIFEVYLKVEIDEKLKVILNWSAGINQFEEENKSSLDYSVPKEIYGKEFELCKIPTQTMKKVKELEKKVHILAKIVIDYQNNSQKYETAISQIKKMLQKEVTRKELIEQHKIEEQRSLQQTNANIKQFARLYEEYYEEKISEISNFYLQISLKDLKQESLMKDCWTSRLRLPDLSGIRIDFISDDDIHLANFLSKCTPEHLKLLAINYCAKSKTGIKSKFYVDEFAKAAARTAKEVYFSCIDFSAEDLETVVKAAHNAERIVFHFCCIHCSSGLNFGADLSYNTKFLSFQYCGSTGFKERTTDWKEDPSCFSLIVDAIGGSGLRTSLEKISIANNQTLSASKVQEELNAKDMSHISVVEEYAAPLSS